MFSLNFIQESPVENCLTSALGRSLSQKNDMWCIGSGNPCILDFATQASNIGYDSLQSGIPA